MPASRVAVIGGGWAGLAAAVTLVQADIPVTLYESAAQLGGRARRVQHHGLVLDNGQHILLGAYQATLKLLREVGIDLERAFLRTPLRLIVHPKFELKAAKLPAPLHLGAGLFAARGLVVADKFSALAFLRALKRQRFKVASGTVHALLTAHGQTPALCNYLWWPLCIAALNTLPTNADAQVFVNVLRDAFFGSRADSELLLPKVDLGRLLPDAAATLLRDRGAKVYCSRTVLSIAAQGSGFEVRDAQSQQAYTAVICALPPFRVPSMLVDLPALQPVCASLAQYRYEPIYTVYLQYSDKIRLPFPMQGLAQSLVQWVFDRGTLCGQAGLLVVVIGAQGRHQHWDHNTLVEHLAMELRVHLGITETPRASQVIAEKRATFACTPALFRPQQATAQPGFYLAGDYTASDYPATLEAAVRSGLQCAHKILETTL